MKPKIGCLVLVLIGLLVGVGFVFIDKDESDRIHQSNLEKITIGMTKKQVEDLFGTPGEPFLPNVQFAEYYSRKWAGKKLCVIVYFSFVNDRVAQVDCEVVAGSEPSFLERLLKMMRGNLGNR
jgi:hypothetical protein